MFDEVIKLEMQEQLKPSPLIKKYEPKGAYNFEEAVKVMLNSLRELYAERIMVNGNIQTVLCPINELPDYMGLDNEEKLMDYIKEECMDELITKLAGLGE